MLRIEVHRHGEPRNEVYTVRTSYVRVGRQSSSDLILPDPVVPRDWFEIRLEPDSGFVVKGPGMESRRVNSSLEMEIGGVRVDIRDLRLLDDEKTLAPGAGRGSWLRHVGWAEAALVIAFLAFQRHQQTEFAKSGTELAGYLATSIAGLLLFVASLSVASKVLTGRFSWDRMLRWSMETFLLVAFVAHDFGGLRWWGPDWVKYAEAKLFLLLVVLGWMLWRLGLEWFPAVSPKVRGVVLGFLVSAMMIHSMRHLIPRDDREHFTRREAMPVLPTLLQYPEESVESYLRRLNESLTP